MTASRHRRLARTGGHPPRRAPVSRCAPCYGSPAPRVNARFRHSRDVRRSLLLGESPGLPDSRCVPEPAPHLASPVPELFRYPLRLQARASQMAETGLPWSLAAGAQVSIRLACFDAR